MKSPQSLNNSEILSLFHVHSIHSCYSMSNKKTTGVTTEEGGAMEVEEEEEGLTPLPSI